jgi:hypothetical protein
MTQPPGQYPDEGRLPTVLRTDYRSFPIGNKQKYYEMNEAFMKMELALRSGREIN